jgi:hypothetical protein
VFGGALSAGLGTVIEVDRPDVFRFPATKLQLHPDTGDIGVKWRDFITLDPRKAASGRGPARNSVELARSANRVCVRAATDHVTAAPPVLYLTVRTP